MRSVRSMQRGRREGGNSIKRTHVGDVVNRKRVTKLLLQIQITLMYKISATIATYNATTFN
jgi:hypothetical protein